MDIIGKRRVYLAISAILVILGLIVLGVVGLNLGVDFTGGSLDVYKRQLLRLHESEGLITTRFL